LFKKFFKSVKLILSNSTLLRRIGITFAILLVFKIGTFITVPLIDKLQIELAMEQLSSGGLLGLLNTFSGGGLSSFSILALGISPYITASIVVQMLQLVIPPLKEIANEGETGKQKLNRITRYVSVGLAFVQALALILGLNVTAVNILDIFVIKDSNLIPLFFIYMSLVITAGSCFTVWIADLITQYGVGNGSSMIIGAGIVTQIPVMVGKLITKYLAEDVVNAANVFNFIIILLLYVLIIL
jgi:preprotein translocase subunit SecY